jgi:hypothetical protein
MTKIRHNLGAGRLAGRLAALNKLSLTNSSQAKRLHRCWRQLHSIGWVVAAAGCKLTFYWYQLVAWYVMHGSTLQLNIIFIISRLLILVIVISIQLDL